MDVHHREETMGTAETIAVENAHMPPFFAKTPISIERGEGVWVWDEDGRRYLDLTAGWGVNSIGHAHPAIVRALAEQGARIIQNPDSGLTYSPARARLLQLLAGILPPGLTRGVFVHQTQGSGIRVFPALTITAEELDEGLSALEDSIVAVTAG
jgi:acetylornithine/succinyldiaminopimelate/putrescine aminotransferase